MSNCCTGLGTKNFKEKFNFDFEQTDKGIKVHIMPKDKSKVDSFKKFVEACNDFCEDECVC